MKTTNNVQKTANREFRNPSNKTFEVAESLVLVSFTVSASGFWNQPPVNNTFGEISGPMVNHETEGNVLLAVSSEEISTTKAFFIEPAKEKDLEIKSWMMDNLNFPESEFKAESESAMELEGWMLNEKIGIN